MPRGFRAPTIELTQEERDELQRLVRRQKTAQALAFRAQIILKAERGHTNIEIADQLGDPFHVGIKRLDRHAVVVTDILEGQEEVVPRHLPPSRHSPQDRRREGGGDRSADAREQTP